MAGRSWLLGVWTPWRHNPALRLGMLTGGYLSCVFIAWLWIANHVPQLYSFAGVRNLIGGVLAVLVMGIPVIRFRRHPGKMLVSGITAWALLTVSYIAMEMRHSLLESRMGALQVFTLGVVSYGFLAVLQWVFLLCVETRQRHVARGPQASVLSARHRAH
jgi:hypothetical protein